MCTNMHPQAARVNPTVLAAVLAVAVIQVSGRDEQSPPPLLRMGGSSSLASPPHRPTKPSLVWRQISFAQPLAARATLRPATCNRFTHLPCRGRRTAWQTFKIGT